MSHSPAFSHLGERARPAIIAELMARALAQPNLLSLAAGFTDSSVLPVQEVSLAVERLASRPGLPEHLQYGTNQGRPGLRAAIANALQAYAGESDGVCKPDDILVTNGSQQALYLAVQVLCEPGDIVLVEQPTYFVFLELLRGLGVEALSLPVNAAGKLDVAALGTLLNDLAVAGRLPRLKAVYLVSYFSNPSSYSVSLSEKAALGRLLSKHAPRVAVLEDAAYRDLYFGVPYPAPSVLSVPEMADLPKIYFGTFTKAFSTGMKIGYAVCPDPVWCSRMKAVKGHQDFGSANFSQAVLETVLEEGLFEKYLERVRPHYAAKAQKLSQALEHAGLRARGWSWEEPEGGLYLWLKGPHGTDTRKEGTFCARCLDNGVLYVPGDLCYAEGQPHDHIRLSFGAIDRDVIPEAAARFARSL